MAVQGDSDLGAGRKEGRKGGRKSEKGQCPNQKGGREGGREGRPTCERLSRLRYGREWERVSRCHWPRGSVSTSRTVWML